MKTIEEKRAALDAEHAGKLAALDIEEKIRAGLPANLGAYAPSIHVYRLYDRAASVGIKYIRFRLSTETTPDPTWETLRRIADGFTPAPLALFRDGCVGVHTLDSARHQYAKAQKRNPDTSAKYTPIAPFWITVEPSPHSQELSVHTIVYLDGAGFVEFRIAYALGGEVARRIGQSIVRRDARSAWDYEHQTVIENSFKLNETIRVLGNARAAQIKYASGSHTNPGQHLIYWDACNGEPADITIATLIEKLESVGEL